MIGAGTDRILVGIIGDRPRNKNQGQGAVGDVKILIPLAWLNRLQLEHLGEEGCGAPGIAATAVLCFILSWNEFLYALILVAFESRTLTVGIPGLVTPHGTLWGQVAAVAIVATLPIIVFTFLVQRHLVRGLTFGAVKG